MGIYKLFVSVYYLTSTLIQKEGRNENRVFSKYTNLHSGNGIHKKEIVTGHLLPGDKIPSVRELASELQVNPNTIQRTFQELERDGVVVTRRGMGRYVTNEGEKIMELRKEMAKELLHSFIDGMDNLGFQKKKFLQFFVLHYMIRGRRANDRAIENRKLMEEIRIKSSDP